MGTTARELLADALRRSAMTARELARGSGIAEGRVSDYLHGRYVPSSQQLARMLEITGYRLRLEPDFDRNGIVLAQLLDLADALSVASPGNSRRSAAAAADSLPNVFAELARSDE